MVENNAADVFVREGESMNASPQVSQQQQQPPAWALEPVTAWIYLVLAIALAFTPVYLLGFILAIIAAVFTYQDRKANGHPAFWWTVAVVIFGALGYIFYVYKRRGEGAVHPPAAAVPQQGYLAQGAPQMPPQALSVPAAPADWYPDPQGEARLRYWDGASWTEHTSE